VEEHQHWGDTSRWVRAGVIAWTLIGVVIIGYGIVLALARVWSAVLPLIIGALIVFILKGPVNVLVRRGMRRIWASIVVYVAAIVIVAGLLVWVVPALARQFILFAELFPVYYESATQLVTEVESGYAALALPEWVDDLTRQLNDSLASWLADFSRTAATGIISAGGAIATGVISVLTGLIIGFLLLNSLPQVRTGLMNSLPPGTRDDARELVGRMNVVVGGFIRGQALIALIVGTLTGLAMTIIGVPFAGMIGVIAGVTNIVPYVGPIVGGFVAAVVALFVDPILAVYAIIAVIIIQQVESSFLSPKIMSDQVGIHPILVIVVLLAGASLGGLLGMLLAVPLAGVIRVSWDFFREKAGWIGAELPEEPEPPPDDDLSEPIDVGSA
jgi:predicted PurR-regulated permease PerM